MSFLLVHSPVVGPATWRWVADALRDAGETVTVPDLVESATAGDPMRFASRAASTASTGDEDVVVVGHSGAGCLLPRIAPPALTTTAARLRRRRCAAVRDTACAYVLLGPGYRHDAATASVRGWPVVERLGTHLDTANDERSIASILIDLAAPSR